MKIVGVRYKNRVVEQVKMDDGKVLTVENAIGAAQRGWIQGFHVGTTRHDSNNPHLTLVSNSDGERSNNLSNLPRF